MKRVNVIDADVSWLLWLLRTLVFFVLKHRHMMWQVEAQINCIIKARNEDWQTKALARALLDAIIFSLRKLVLCWSSTSILVC